MHGRGVALPRPSSGKVVDAVRTDLLHVELVERALLSTQSTAAGRSNAPYDARADLELSKLLEALDEGGYRIVAPLRGDAQGSLSEEREADLRGGGQ